MKIKISLLLSKMKIIRCLKKDIKKFLSIFQLLFILPFEDKFTIVNKKRRSNFLDTNKNLESSRGDKNNCVFINI